MFTRGHLAAAGLGEREPLLCQNTPMVPQKGAHVGVEGPTCHFPPITGSHSRTMHVGTAGPAEEKS